MFCSTRERETKKATENEEGRKNGAHLSQRHRQVRQEWYMHRHLHIYRCLWYMSSKCRINRKENEKELLRSLSCSHSLSPFMPKEQSFLNDKKFLIFEVVL
jgi:hypothetical protein